MGVHFLTAYYQDAKDISDFLLRNNFEYFNPHQSDADAIENILKSSIKDIYKIVIQDGVEGIIGYGMLRGLDEGYDIPTLGIAIDNNYQGLGIGKKFIQHLHAICVNYLGVCRVRIGVMKGNNVAKKLYENIGYKFTEERKDREYGYIEL